MKIGFLSLPVTGHLNPMTGLARKLRGKFCGSDSKGVGLGCPMATGVGSKGVGVACGADRRGGGGCPPAEAGVPRGYSIPRGIDGPVIVKRLAADADLASVFVTNGGYNGVQQVVRLSTLLSPKLQQTKLQI
jgi:hypothetical protein